MKLLNRKGFSLVSVMIAAGMLGGLSLAVMQVMKNITDGQSRAYSISDEIELFSSIRMILDDPNHCKVSLASAFNTDYGAAGSGNTFQKKDIDFDQDLVQMSDDYISSSEGLDVELWYGNSDGSARVVKKFNGADNTDRGDDKSTSGKIKIKSMKLVMGKGAGPNSGNYAAGSESDIGQLVVIYDKKINSKNSREAKKIFDLTVGVSTVASGVSKIVSCGPVPLPAAPQTTVVAIHTYTAGNTPSCPSGWNTLWTGYSFFMADGGAGISFGSDMGKSGSCLKKFIPVPILECGSSSVCNNITPGDYGYWLSTNGSNTGEILALNAPIRTCAVCKGTKPLLTIHSQTTSSPTCPSGWSSEWSGFSFFMMGGGNGSVSGVDLSSPGSCVRGFAKMPIIECKPNGTCEVQSPSDYVYYLSTRSNNSGNLNNAQSMDYTSRCRVCSKDLIP